MNEQAQSISAKEAESRVDLLDYWRVIWKERRLVLSLSAGCSILALVVSLLMPKVYEATATILPPLDPNPSGILAAATGLSEKTLALGLPTSPATPIDLFRAMLSSQTLAEEIVKRFDLARHYGVEFEEDAVKNLRGNTDIDVSPQKLLKVTVAATNPKLAADLANAYVTGLEMLNQTLAISKAGQNRKFIEKRLAEAKTDLVEAEQALAGFQAKNKTVALPEQASAALRAAAEIQGRISAVDVQLEVMKNFLTEDHLDLIRLRLEKEQLKRQVHLLESGKEGKGMLPGDNLHPAFVTVPVLGLAYAKLLRDVKVQETLYTLLSTHYEQARLAEARDTPTVQVLDLAKPPIRKSKPKIKLNMLMAGVLGLWIGILYALARHNLDRTRSGWKSDTASTSSPGKTAHPSSSKMIEVAATYEDVDDLIKDVELKPDTPIKVGVRRFVEWYRRYYKAKR